MSWSKCIASSCAVPARLDLLLSSGGISKSFREEVKEEAEFLALFSVPFGNESLSRGAEAERLRGRTGL